MHISYTQQQVTREISGSDVTYIQIDTRIASVLKVTTHTSQQAKVILKTEGEFTEEIFLVVQKPSAGVLSIKPAWNPAFKLPDDKLSAHKVVSVLLEVHIPENRRVSIKGGNTLSVIRGVYEKVSVQLEDADCYLEDVIGFLEIVVNKGNIHILNDKATIKATAIHGKVAGKAKKTNGTYIVATVKRGNVYINKPE